MAISFSCECGKKYQVKEEFAGRRAKCSSCGKPLTVPRPESPAYDLEPEAPRPEVDSTFPVVAPIQVSLRDDDNHAGETDAPDSPYRNLPMWTTVAVLNIAIITVAIFAAQSFVRSENAENGKIENKSPRTPSPIAMVRDRPTDSSDPSANQPDPSRPLDGKRSVPDQHQPLLAAPVSSGNNHPLTTAEIVERCEGSVALIRGKLGSGTGFMIRQNTLVTNAHVIESEFVENLEVYFPSAPEDVKGPYSATLLYENHKRDLAILQVQTSLPPLVLAESYSFQRGEDVTIIGNPGVGGKTTLQNAISKGVMSTEMEIEGQRFYQLGASVNPGNSGGPALNALGQVIGVVSARAQKEEALGFCVPIEDLLSSIKIVESSKPETQAEAGREHTIKVVFRSLSAAGNIYTIALDAYVNGMEKAMELGGSADDGVASVRNALDEQISIYNEVLTFDMKKHVSIIVRDPAIEASLRNDLQEMWSNYTTMKSYIDNPRGTYSSFKAEAIELTDTHKALIERINLALGIDLE